MILVIYFDIFHKDLERRLQENNIPYKLVKYDDLINENHIDYKTIIICGSRKRILRDNDLPLLDPYLKQDNHIIGICFGFQFLALKSGGEIEERELFRGIRLDRRLDRRSVDQRLDRRSVDQRLDRRSVDHMSLYYNHHDCITYLPPTWTIIQKIDGFINIASTNKWIGFQFHPEKNNATFRHYLLPFLRL
jgi:GMP synthase-like glutamine amidotransferase